MARGGALVYSPPIVRSFALAAAPDRAACLVLRV